MDTLVPLLPGPCIISGGPISNRIPDISPTESALVKSAVTRRQREFACGRYHAHQILQSLGQDTSVVIGREQDGRPQWPQGIIGSISHTADYCIVAAGTAADMDSIGIDLENSERLKPQLWPRLFVPRELEKLNNIKDPVKQRQQAAITFSAKEAFYKCDFPLNRKHISFTDIEISLQKNNNLKLIHTGNNTVLHYRGLYCPGPTHVLTLIIKMQT